MLSLGTWEGIEIYSEDSSVSGGDRETDVGTAGWTGLYFKEVIFTSVRRRGWKKTLEIL